MERLEGLILTPDGLVRGRIWFDEFIREIEPAPVDGPLILPGFVDVHVHGGGGFDTMDGAKAVRELARFHLRHGTTTILPTTITNPWPQVLEALRGVASIVSGPRQDLPDIPGAHLEGPFISPQRLGAQPPYAVDPTPELVEEVLELDVVRVVTIAPELPGALEAARRFARAGVRVSVGHSVASYEQVAELANAVWDEGGEVGFTHLFNAMGGIEGRKPGVAGAALALRRAYAELIFDGHHVAAGSLHAARAAKLDRLLFVTDCMAAGGMGDGRSSLGGQEVVVEGGTARLADGTLAGSVLTLDQALRNALAAGVPLVQASRHLSLVPARYLGLHDRGQLAVGQRAHLVALDERYEVLTTIAGGDNNR